MKESQSKFDARPSLGRTAGFVCFGKTILREGATASSNAAGTSDVTGIALVPAKQRGDAETFRQVNIARKPTRNAQSPRLVPTVHSALPAQISLFSPSTSSVMSVRGTRLAAERNMNKLFSSQAEDAPFSIISTV